MWCEASDRLPDSKILARLWCLLKKITGLEDLGKIVVSTEKGVPVLLNDLGKLKYGNLERKGVFGYMVSTEKGVPVLLNDLGKLKYGNLERKGVFGYTDRSREYAESIEGIVLLLKHENPSVVLEGIQAAVDELNNEILPQGAQIHTFLDRTELVNTTLRTVSHTLLEGMVLVIIVLIVFLGNWRGAVLVALTIPVSLLIAFILMHLTDIPANLLSLG
ncbi:AcrB/AcrD/AcrF family, partial [Popillia japonica]